MEKRDIYVCLSPYFWRFSEVPLDRRQEEHGWLTLPTGAVTIQLGDDNVTIQLGRDKDRQLKSIRWWIKLNVTSSESQSGIGEDQRGSGKNFCCPIGHVECLS